MRITKISILLLLMSIFSCVPVTKFKEIDGKRANCEKENETLKSQVERLTVENTESKQRISVLDKLSQDLIKDSVERAKLITLINKDKDRISQLYADLQKSQEELLKGNAKEISRLMQQLQTTQEDLQKKEDDLKKMERSLNEKKASLDNLTIELEKRNARLKEVEAILNRKDSVVKALKAKVSEALLGFENDGLTIKVQNGKVYVSMEEKLLFKSGSYEVDPRGADALKKLAKVLEKNNDISITVEGHTDDVPYRQKGDMYDNWDLSVKRSTSIVRILLGGSSIDPKRLTAAGRGEFLPVDPTKSTEARQKNRRTEIILTPKLDELFKILENN